MNSQALPTGTVTFLFTDIEGSTRLAQQYPDAMRVLLARHHEILRQAIQAQNGYIFQNDGDSLAVAFHSPLDALNAALAAQQLLQKESWSPAPIKVRMGIHTGTAKLNEASVPTVYTGYTTLATTQRVMSAGHGGQVLLSGATHELTRNSLPANMELVDLGEKRLKDLLRPEHLFQLNIAGLPTLFPPLKTLDSFRNNLPIQLTTFIGREKEIAEVKQELESHRLVTLTGPGGAGKTRLSLQVAADLLDRFTHGVWFVELAPLTDPELISQTIISAIGLSEQTGKPTLELLKEYLHEKKSLIVLDNCEHLIEASAKVANALLNTAPGLKIMASSREALGVHGELSYPVPSLSLPDPKKIPDPDLLTEYEAVHLFTDRALLANPHFIVIKDNAPAIAQICIHLDGIPLAIELAAARVRGLSVEQIASRLDDRFHLLTSGARTVLPRHQTLQALIDWSHELLIESERVLLRRLAVFSGGWTLEAAESVCASNDLESNEILDTLLHLVDKSLVLAETLETESRYHMLETIRQYAHEKLWAAGEGELLRQRHLAYFVGLAERAEPNLRAFDMVIWLDRLEAEHDNIRTTLEWAQESDVETQLRLASALQWFWHICGHKSEGIDWLERGLSIEVLERGEQPLWTQRAMIRGKALNTAGFLRLMSGEIDKGAALSEESLRLFRELGTTGRRGMAYTLLNMAVVADNMSLAIHRGKELLEESLAVFQELGDKFGRAECLMGLGFAAMSDGDYEQARMIMEEHLALRKEIGDKDGVAIAFRVFGNLAIRQGDYKRATTHFETSLSLFRELRNKWAMSLLLADLGHAARAQGNYKQATEILEESRIYRQDVGDKFHSTVTLINLGSVARSQGDYERATQLHEEGLALFREFGEKLDVAYALRNLGLTAFARGDDRQAENRFEEVLMICQGIEEKYQAAVALYGLGRVAQAQGNYTSARARYAEGITILRDNEIVGEHLEGFALLAVAQNHMERAARLFSASQTLYNAIHFEMSARERAEHDEAIAAVRAALDEERFMAAYEEGKKITLDEAVAYALEEIHG